MYVVFVGSELHVITNHLGHQSKGLAFICILPFPVNCN